jgi:ribulose-phosphate 3-epimerase
MSVNPGFGGQKFIEAATDKVARLKALRTKYHANFIIEVDGGVNLHTGAQLAAAGADALVAGSFVFGSENPVQTIAELKAL